MQKILGYLLLSSLAMGSTVWAQDQIVGGVTERPVPELSTERGVFDAALSISPHIGNLNYQAANANHTNRILEGFTLNWNAPRTLSNMQNTIFGIETGLLFSHNGPTGSNFWGTNSGSVAGDLGSNSFLIPLNLNVGYQFSDQFALSVLAGANLLYRSVASSMIVGRAGDANGLSSSSDFLPSLGLNAGWELTKAIGIALRGDAMFAPAAPMYTATIGATFPLA